MVERGQAGASDELSLVCSLHVSGMASGVLMNLLSGLHSSRFEWSIVVVSLKLLSSHPAAVCRLRGENRQFYFADISSQENRKKTRNVTYWQNAQNGRRPFTERKNTQSQWTWHYLATHNVAGFSHRAMTPSLFFPGNNFIPTGTTELGSYPKNWAPNATWHSF